MTTEYVNWFSLMNGMNFGVVVGKDEITGKKKAYVGIVPGLNKISDIANIKAMGSPLSLEAIAELHEAMKDD